MTSNFHMVKKHFLNAQFLKTIWFYPLPACHCTKPALIFYTVIQGNKPITLLITSPHFPSFSFNSIPILMPFSYPNLY